MVEELKLRIYQSNMSYYKVSNLFFDGYQCKLLFNVANNDDFDKIKPLIDSKLLNIESVSGPVNNIYARIFGVCNCIDMINTIIYQDLCVKINEEKYKSIYTFPAGFKLSRVEENKYEVIVDNNVKVLFNFINSLIGSAPLFRCEFEDNKFYIILNDGYELDKTTIVSKEETSTLKPLKDIISLDVNWI